MTAKCTAREIYVSASGVSNVGYQSFAVSLAESLSAVNGRATAEDGITIDFPGTRVGRRRYSLVKVFLCTRQDAFDRLENSCFVGKIKY